MGLLLAHGGWDHFEGLLGTTAFYPEKVCSRHEKLGSAVREIPSRSRTRATLLGIINPDEKQVMYFNACEPELLYLLDTARTHS